jgi:hypothetical protein
LGLLVDIWLWAIAYAPHGDISGFPDQDIAEAADWGGDAKQFVDALTETGWRDPDGKLHNWEKHRLYFDALQEKQSRVRDQTRERVANWRAKQKTALEEKGNGNALRSGRVTHDETRTEKHGNAPIEEKRIEEKRVHPPYPPKGGKAGGEPSAGRGVGDGGTILAKAITEVADGFAIILDQNIGDPNWQTVYGRSIARHSRKLVTLFGGDSGKALDCIEGIVKHAKARGWTDWTPKTVVDRAGDWAAGRLGRR